MRLVRSDDKYYVDAPYEALVIAMRAGRDGQVSLLAFPATNIGDVQWRIGEYNTKEKALMIAQMIRDAYESGTKVFVIPENKELDE